MTLKTLKLLAAVGALSASFAVAQDAPKAKLPPTEMAANQKLAEKVAKELAALPGTADLKVYTEGGTVTLVGTCKEEAHKAGVLKAVQVIDGVSLVRDGVKVEKAEAVKPAMPAVPATMPAAMPTVKQTQALDGGPRLTAAPTGVPPGPMADPAVEPQPLGPAGGMAGGPPHMPNHAWPTYAPYNAFPYIGPYYPFPKVPLGWRSVTLSWEDGHWWMGRKHGPADYWRVKFGY